MPDGMSFLATAMHLIGGFTLGLSYISGITLLFINGRSHWFEKYFSPIGRMALSNYLLQSIVCAFLFHSYGFGLFGNIERWQGILLVLCIFTMQVFFSRWWLSKYQFGPFEWLWRGLTYKQWPSIKKETMR